MADLIKREFHIETLDKSKIKDLTNGVDIWVYQPNGIGFSTENEYIKSGGQKTRISSNIGDNNITFTLVCDSYETFNAFANEWINGNNIFRLHYYTTDSDKANENYCLCDFNQVLNTEKNENNLLMVDISLNQLSPFGNDVRQTIDLTGGLSKGESGGEIPIDINTVKGGWELITGTTSGVPNQITINNNTNFYVYMDFLASGIPGSTFSFNITNDSPYEYYKRGEFYKSSGLGSVLSKASYPQKIEIGGVKTYMYANNDYINYIVLSPGTNVINFEGNGSTIDILYTEFRLC